MLQNQSQPLVVDGGQPQQGSMAASPRAQKAPLTLTIPLSFGGFGKYLLLFLFIAVYEVVAPTDAKLSAILGRFEGNTENASLRATVDALQLKVKMEQDERAKAENRINEYRSEAEARYRTEMETKLAQVRNQLDLQLQSEIEKIKANYDFCNKVKLAGLNAIVLPLEEQLKTALKLDVLTSGQGFGELMRAFYGGSTNIQSEALNKIKAATEELLAHPCQIQVTFSAGQGGTLPQPAAPQPETRATSQAAPQPVAPQSVPPSAFQTGAQERMAWEKWFAGLPVGDYRSGAFYWSAKRNTTPRGSCTDARNASYGEFTRGCLEAKKFLDAVDQRRTGDPEYRQGWNSYSPPARSNPASCSVIGIKPDDADGGLNIRATAARGARAVGVIPYNGRGVTNYDCPCDGNDRRCHVAYKGVEGWVSGQYLFPD